MTAPYRGHHRLTFTGAKAVGVLVDEKLVRIVPGRGAYVIARG